MDSVNIAIPKGRILKEALNLLNDRGISSLHIEESSRKLIFEDRESKINFFILRNADVITYIERGICDCGISGSDLIKEENPDVFVARDLGIAKCRMMVAMYNDGRAFDDIVSNDIVRIATKYPNIARRHFIDKGIQTEIIKLYGSVELAVIVGLADLIVDIVSTGRTMRENNLVEVEHISNISSFFIINKTSYYAKYERIKEILDAL